MTPMRILARPEARRLVLAAFTRPRSALELSHQTGIPIAKCYRLLWRLRRAGLIRVHGAYIFPTGRAKLLFRGKLRDLELFLTGGKLMARAHKPRISESSEPSEGP